MLRRLSGTLAKAILLATPRAIASRSRSDSETTTGFFAADDKLAMTRQLFREQFAMDLDGVRAEVVYIGDSPNDAPMFEFFPKSVGVANIQRFAGALPAAPKYVASASSGAGFAEVIAHLLRT